MAKKSAADVASDLKDKMGKDSTPEILRTPEKKNASKSVWKGYISAFGVMLIPAAAYKATDEDKIERHMYHSADCLNSLQQGKMNCSGCGAVGIDKSAAVKGVEVNGKIVLISDDEMESQKPASDKVLKITEFVPVDAVDPTYYASSEYLAAGEGGEKAFATFQQALASKNRVAIGTFVSKGHQYTVAIRAKGQYGLVMSYLYAEHEVRNCGKWKAVQVNQDEVALCEQLMTETEMAKDVFTPAAYDPFIAKTRKMIADKANGTEVCKPVAEEEVKTGTDDLLAALKATLNQQKSKAAKA
jgi:DNA end-binding protein Ku